MSGLHRRTFVIRAAHVAAVGPLLGWSGCSDPSSESTGGDDGSSGLASTGKDDSIGDASSATTSSTTTGGSSSSSSGDATTGTSSGTGAASTGEDDGSSGSTGSPACEPTPADIEGPFYRPNIPVGSDLDVHGDTGVPLVLQGRVRNDACQPIVSAVVEIWHATPVAPAGEPGDQNATYDDSAEYRYYGQVATDAEGRFMLSTLRPGWYLNGPQYRPAHVHLKVWVGGRERLTTQLYFVDDPFNATDAWFNPQMALDPDGSGVAELELVV